MHILSLVTDNSPSWISGREEKGRRNYFMTNLYESMGPDWDRTIRVLLELKVNTIVTFVT